MILLISGASHTGKTFLSQKLMEKYTIPYISIDHIKMGLIRSGYTTLTPADDLQLTDYLWPILREMIKTAIENNQSFILEGCYIPFDFQKSFTKEYLSKIQYYSIIFSEKYIEKHFEEICDFEEIIEERKEKNCSLKNLIQENLYYYRGCRKENLPYIYIEETYDIQKIINEISIKIGK